jgi:hypothetical protein
MERYEGTITVEFEDIPPVRLQTIIPKPELNLLERLALATKRRLFTLRHDWLLKVDNVSYDERLSGTIKIPALDATGKEIPFDGASVPLPWLVSLLTIGILRPLGVMLTASVVHDYAYMYGHIQKEDGTVVKVERHIADQLFKDIIATVNKLPSVGYIAWFFVRIGWLFVKYNNKPRGGKAPFDEYFFFSALLTFIVVIGMRFSFDILLTALVVLYVFFFVLSIIVNRRTLVEEPGNAST